MRISTNMMAQTGINTIQKQQSDLLKTQQQLATGRKILTPADDPTGATRVLNLDKAIGQVDQYNRNLDRAEFALKTEESALVAVGDTVQRIRELTVQALNATNDGGDRALIAKELRQRLDQLVDLANSQDGNGEYLFAGSNSQTQPFILEGGDVNYTGDQTQRLIQAGPGRGLATNHTGYETFMRIREGNGEFTVAAETSNSGTAILGGPGRVVDRSIPFDGPYEILFEEVDDEMTYSVGRRDEFDVFTPLELSDDPLDPMPYAGVPYVRGEAITFDGRQITISGTPADGDSFTAAEAGFKSLFRTVSDLATAMEASEFAETDADRASFQNSGGNALGDLDQSLSNLLGVRSEVGARLSVIDAERDANEASLLDLKSTRSGVEDIDYAEVISRLNLQQVGLEAAQQSYVRIQGLSLFNFL